MSKQLPESPNLEHLKNEAKALKKQTGQRLAEAQLQIARDYGFPSWAKLKRHVEGFPDLRRAFFLALRDGDHDRAQKLLGESPTLIHSRDPDSFGQTPIAAAASRNDLKMVDLVLSSGADVNARSDWWAGSFGALDFCDERTANYLIANGAILTAHAAARLGKAKELRQILKSSPDAVHERGGDGQFPLHFAQTAEIVDILMDAGADPDARDVDHEGTAAQWRIKNSEVLRRLVERGAATDIFIAIALDDPALIQKHLDQDPACLDRKSNEPGNPMIPVGAPGAHIYTYELGSVRPLQAAANLDKDRAYEVLFHQSTPAAQFLAACWKGDRETARKLKGSLKDLSPQDASQIADAAKNRRHDLLALMLDLGFPVDAQDHEGMSALHWAGFHGDAEAVRLILPHNPSLTLKNGYGGNALSTACYGSMHGWYAKTGNYAECARLLIEAGADPANLHGNPQVDEVLKAALNPGES
jgi:ankyrin repeat protein